MIRRYISPRKPTRTDDSPVRLYRSPGRAGRKACDKGRYGRPRGWTPVRRHGRVVPVGGPLPGLTGGKDAVSSNKRRTVREAAAENGSKSEEGSPGVGPDGVTYSSSNDELYAAAVAIEKVDGFPAWFPAGMRKGSHGQGLLLSRLVDGAEQLRQLEAATVQDVADARALGASWQLVGLALGISGEGARSRYGRPAGQPATGKEAASS